jgi:hypothetical protein
MKEVKDNQSTGKYTFVEPELSVTIFSDDLILADSDRCCDDHANFVGYT